jgi:hypothetical protein
MPALLDSTRPRKPAATSHLTLLLAIVLAGCASARQFRKVPSTTTLAPGAQLLPVEWVEDLTLVAVVVDGKPAGRFMLDTGASVVVLTPSIIDALGLRRVAIGGNGGRLFGANGTSVRCEYVVPIAELRCGPLVARGVDAVELDLTQFARAFGQAIDGVLPVTAFRDVLLTLDYVERRVEVGGLPPAAPGGPHTLPLRPQPDLLPYVPMRIAGSEVALLLDSGSTEFLSLPDAVAKPRRGKPVETGKSRTLGGDVPTHQVRLDGRLDIAGHALIDPVVEVVRGSDGALGTALLRHFRVAIDQFHGCVTFSRASGEPLTSGTVRGTGVGLVNDGTHWTVGYLIEGTAAVASGLRVGDELLAIGGVGAADLSRGRLGRLLDEHDVLRFRVRDGNDVREVDVPVAVLVR